MAWGWNGEGECNVPSANDYVGVAAGVDHALGLKRDGSIVAWGLDTAGQCDVPSPDSGFVRVAAAGNHSLALRANGTIAAWGSNSCGEGSAPPQNDEFVDLAAGDVHNLGLKSGGTITAWGDNSHGECDVPAQGCWSRVAAGCDFSLGLKRDGSILGWGWCDFGQCAVPSPNTDFNSVVARGWTSFGLRLYNWVTSVGQGEPGMRAERLVVSPNPSFGTCRISMELPVRSHLTARVFDVSGREVRQLCDGVFPSGVVALSWDGRTDMGGRVPGGAYFVRVQRPGKALTRKLIVLPPPGR